MSPIKKKTSNKKPSNIATRAARAKEEILHMQDDIVPGPGIVAGMRKRMAIWKRLPLTALVHALALHEKYGAKVGDFDAAGVREAVEYEQGITPLLDVANAFVRRLEDGKIERRSRIGKQPLGLVMSLRAAARYGVDPEVQRDLDELEALIMKKHPRKAKAAPAAAPSPAPPPLAASNGARPSVSTPSVDVTVHSAS